VSERQRYTPVPDSVLQSSADFGQIDNAIDPESALPVAGSQAALIEGTGTKIAEVGEAR
jgi:pre-mRNA-processing factor 6